MGCNCGKNKKTWDPNNPYGEMIAKSSRVPYKEGVNPSILSKTKAEQQALLKKATEEIKKETHYDHRFRWKLNALANGNLHDYQNMVDKELKEEESALRARVNTIGGPEEEKALKEFLQRKKNQ